MPRPVFLLVLLLLTFAGCAGNIPESVKMLARELPARADGQYAPLGDDVRKQLVMKDALLACKIDIAGGTEEIASDACKCAESSGDWRVDCKGWLGPHLPPSPAAKGEP